MESELAIDFAYFRRVAKLADFDIVAQQNIVKQTLAESPSIVAAEAVVKLDSVLEGTAVVAEADFEQPDNAEALNYELPNTVVVVDADFVVANLDLVLPKIAADVELDFESGDTAVASDIDSDTDFESDR